jgi:hypothetical protein
LLRAPPAVELSGASNSAIHGQRRDAADLLPSLNDGNQSVSGGDRFSAGRERSSGGVMVTHNTMRRACAARSICATGDRRGVADAARGRRAS